MSNLGQKERPQSDFDIQSRKPGSPPTWMKIAAEVIRRMPAGRYRLLRWLGDGPDKSFVARMPRTLGGYEFHCSGRDQIEREVFFAGCYEPQESACLRDILKPGMMFVDAGANWGFFTLLAAYLVGSTGKVVAIEADPRVLVKLKSNVERNCLGQVQVFGIAVADHDGEVQLAAHDETGENRGISRLIEDDSAAPLIFTVRSQQLDSLLHDVGLDRVDLLKIDVEGAEDMVLAGMEGGLKTGYYHRILLELHPVQLADRRRTIREVAGLLMARGYKGFALDYSLASYRKAHYKPWLPCSEFLRPLEDVLGNAKEQSHPGELSNVHTIWVSPQQGSLL